MAKDENIINLRDKNKTTIEVDTGSFTLDLNDYDMIDYKFNERNLIEEFQSYIDSTYKGHYATNKFQSTEVIIERGHGTGFVWATSISIQTDMVKKALVKMLEKI